MKLVEQHIKITTGDIATAIALSYQLPEFTNHYDEMEYEKRLSNTLHLTLIAYFDDKPVGFKIGYAREDYFYSWVGGVLPDYRRHGIAKMLADEQEKWAKKQNFDTIVFRTRNRHKAMLTFAINNGFDIIGVEPREMLAEYRILLKKKL